jgi:hypothetical protein
VCYTWKYLCNRPPLALMKLPVQRGPKRRRRGCGHSLAGPARHHLALVGYWLGLDACHGGILPSLDVWMGLSSYFPLCTSGIRFLLCAFCLILFVFHLIPKMCLAKHVFSNTSGTRSIVKAYVSKVCLFLLF